MKNNAKSITIKDVALLADVSISTVSRVLNSDSTYPVNEKLIIKVQEAAEKLNYSPNLIGRQLKNRSSNDIGVLVPSLTNPFYPLLLNGVEFSLKKRNYNLLLFNSGRDSKAETNCLKNMQQKRVAGIIVSSISSNQKLLEDIIADGIKVVTFDQLIGNLSCSKVYINPYKGGQLGTEHLLKLNHKRIAFISSPLDRYSRLEVLRGYKETLSSNGIHINEKYIWVAKSEAEIEGEIFEYENGRIATNRMMSLLKPPTAIFCGNDMTAYGCLQELLDQNIKVPDEVSVLGDNNFSISSITNPPLTTINIPAFQMGRLSADILIDQIENIEKNNVVIELTPNLIIRKSTSECKEELIK